MEKRFTFQQIKQKALELARVHRSSVLQFEVEKKFNGETWRKLSEIGFFGVLETVKRDPQNSIAHWAPISELYESLAFESADLPFTCSAAVQGAVALDILEYAGLPQKNATLWEDFKSGAKVICIANNDPGASVFLKNLQTNSQETQGTMRVSGHKSCVTNAPAADFFIVSARNSSNPKSINLFLCAKHPSIEVKNLVPNMLGFFTGSTGSCLFRDLEIEKPEAQILAGEGRGQELIQRCFMVERFFMGSLSLGLFRRIELEARAALERNFELVKSSQYLQEKFFRISKARAILESLVASVRVKALEGATPVELNENLCFLKEYICNEAIEVCQSWIELEGGKSVCENHFSQKIFRDLTMLKFFGGTAELQKISFVYELMQKIEAGSRERESA